MYTTANVHKIAAESLFVSEPPPEEFGNGPNAQGDQHWTHANWLKSRLHFSFNEYHDPQNHCYGALRVLNDDLIQPGRGFGQHPNKDMELLTYVIDGFLTHTDSLGNEEVLERGDMQCVTAGTGYQHAEQNADPRRALRLIRMWVIPFQEGLEPSYSVMRGDPEKRSNQWRQLVAAKGNENAPDDALRVAQDLNLFTAEMDTGSQVWYELPRGRQAYILCVEGKVHVHPMIVSGPLTTPDTVLKRHDAAKVEGPVKLTFSAQRPLRSHETLGPAGARMGPKDPGPGAHVLFIEMKRK